MKRIYAVQDFARGERGGSTEARRGLKKTNNKKPDVLSRMDEIPRDTPRYLRVLAVQRLTFTGKQQP
jgi:hypothetical protein